jgi:hypothetical protein
MFSAATPPHCSPAVDIRRSTGAFLLCGPVPAAAVPDGNPDSPWSALDATDGAIGAAFHMVNEMTAKKY